MTRRWFFRCSAACLFVMLSLPADEVLAGKPIPCGKDAFTRAQLEKDQTAYFLTLLDFYEKCTQDPPEVRKARKEFSREVLQCSDGTDPSLNWQKLNEKGDKLLSENAADPLVLTNIGLVKMQLGKSAEAVSILVQAHEAFSDSKYPASCKFRACNRLRLALLNAQSPPQAWEPYQKDFARLLVAYLMDVTAEPKNRRLIWISVENSLQVASDNPRGFALQTAIYDEVQKAEKVDPWIKSMVNGWHHFSLGWKLRGNGFANTVSKEGMQGFAENMAKAAEFFTKAWEIDPQLPEAPAAMIQVSMGGGDPKLSPRDWFDRAVEAQMDYDPAYKSLTWSLRPRWGGSHDEMYRFGLDCLATKRFDTGVPEKLVQILMDIDSEIGRRNEIWAEEGVFENVKLALEGAENEPSRRANPRLNSIEWNLTALALIASHARQFDEARKALDKLNDKLQPEAFPQFSMRYPYDAARIYALSASVRNDVQTFDTLVSDSGYREPDNMKSARELLDKAVAKDADPHAKPYFDYWNTRLRWQEQFDKGEWVELTFDKSLSMWEPQLGSWSATNQHTIVGIPGSSEERYQLKCTVPFDSPLEIECDVQCEQPDRQMFAGLMMGTLWRTQSTELGAFFSVNFAQKAAHFTSRSHQNWPERFYLADPQKCHLLIRYWRSAFEFSADGQFVTPHGPFPKLPFPPPISLAYNNGKAQFHNLRLRKLTYGPPPSADDDSERLVYFGEAIRRDPRDAHAYVERGVANKKLGDIEEALADFHKAAKLASRWSAPWYHIAETEYQRRHYRQAIDAIDQFVKIIDDMPQPYLIKSSILATVPDDKIRNGKLAIESAEKACRLTGYRMPEALQALAAAHAETGNFDEAVKWAQKSKEMAPEAKKARCQEEIELYQSRKPLRKKPASQTHNPPAKS